MATTIDTLPNEVMNLTIQNLDYFDVIAIQRVNKHFRDLSLDFIKLRYCNPHEEAKGEDDELGHYVHLLHPALNFVKMQWEEEDWYLGFRFNRARWDGGVDRMFIRLEDTPVAAEYATYAIPIPLGEFIQFPLRQQRRALPFIITSNNAKMRRMTVLDLAYMILVHEGRRGDCYVKTALKKISEGFAWLRVGSEGGNFFKYHGCPLELKFGSVVRPEAWSYWNNGPVTEPTANKVPEVLIINQITR